MPRDANSLAFPPGIGPPRCAGKLIAAAEGVAGAAALFFCLALLHLPLLNLPYFWDEAGYYIPAARDLLLSGSLIPHSTLSNAHPPLVMIWLALAWKLFGFRPLVTRLAMLAVAAFTLAGVFRLARQVANRQVALGATACSALFPVFFAQSSLAHLDMAAAGFTLWALAFYLRDRRWQSSLLFCLAALAKETAIIAPLSLVIWELACPRLERRLPELCLLPRDPRRTAWLLLPLVPLGLWFAYHYSRTGFVLGNPEFLRYNLTATLNPLRFLAALAERLWQLLGYLNMFVLTLATLLAMRRAPLLDLERAANKVTGNGGRQAPRPRISISVQMIFAAVLVGYLLVLSLIGGAVLARYLLPVYPLAIIICVSTIWRRLPWWRTFLGVVCLGFVIGLVTSPPYHFAPEDNLDYAEYVHLHQRAAHYAEAHYPRGPILTAWPASDELTHPYLGYVSAAIPVVRIENFSASELLVARQAAAGYEAALVFSTKYEPPYGFLLRLPYWQQLQQRYFGYHRDLPPAAAAQKLGGHIVWTEAGAGQWAAVIEMDRALNAALCRPPAACAPGGRFR